MTLCLYSMTKYNKSDQKMEDGPEGPPSKMEPRPNGPGQCLERVADSWFRVAKKKPGEGVYNAYNVKCTEHYQHTVMWK